MNQQDEPNRDEEARRLLSEAFSGELTGDAAEQVRALLGLLYSIGAVTTVLGWELDGPSVVRAFAISSR